MNQNTQRMKFTGHERDLGDPTSAADDLDYMHARFDNGPVGRFLSVDPAKSATLRRPQSWNRYSYALNNPIKYVDPDGETAVAVSLDHDMEALANHVPTQAETRQKFAISVLAASLLTPADEFTAAGFVGGAAVKALARTRVGQALPGCFLIGPRSGPLMT